MFESVAKASWDDVILDKSKKSSIINDVDTFFDSQAMYERLKVPWKRGIIYYGSYISRVCNIGALTTVRPARQRQDDQHQGYDALPVRSQKSYPYPLR